MGKSIWETTILIISAILGKIENKWYLAKFATLSKTVENDYFDHICHTEQKHGRSDNLTLSTTLGKTQMKMIFCSNLLSWAKLLKNEFWSHLLI